MYKVRYVIFNQLPVVIQNALTADKITADLLLLNHQIDINIIFSEGIVNSFEIINYQFEGRNVDNLWVTFNSPLISVLKSN